MEGTSTYICISLNHQTIVINISLSVIRYQLFVINNPRYVAGILISFYVYAINDSYLLYIYVHFQIDLQFYISIVVSG